MITNDPTADAASCHDPPAKQLTGEHTRLAHA